MTWLTQLTMLLFSGILAGFLIAAPVGPTGILCIRRSLHSHFILAALTGLGAGLADTFYGAVASFGLASIATLLHEYDQVLRFFGGGALIALGIKVMRSHPSLENGSNGDSTAYFRAMASSFFVTLANPATLIAFTAAFAALGLNELNDSFSQAATVVLGVFIGATCWWLGLSSGVYLLRSKMTEDVLVRINYASGGALILFAIYLLWTSHYIV